MRSIKKATILILILVMMSAVPFNSYAARVHLNKTKVTLRAGKTVTLKVIGTKKKVKWSSTKKSVASVSKKGKVKAKKKGKAYIVAKVGKKKYRCRIIVKAKAAAKPQTDPPQGNDPLGPGIEYPNTIKDTSIYLKTTTNCPVGNSAIKNTVNSLVSGLTGTNSKAKAIFNYVNGSIKTVVYNNDTGGESCTYNGEEYKYNITYHCGTRFGATATLSNEYGGCVDQAHLLVAMLRTAGIPARYVHVSCYFNGKTQEICGNGLHEHVYVEFLTAENNWHALDTVKEASKDANSPDECKTNYLKNTFNNIVTWDRSNYTLHSYYSSLHF